MTHRTTLQEEIPEAPSPGRLRKLRTLIPMAEAIHAHARAVDIAYPSGEKDDPDSGSGKVSLGDMKACASRRRALDRRLDALGVPIREYGLAYFPERTQDAARASSEFWVALESAGSALRYVRAAELATVGLAGPR